MPQGRALFQHGGALAGELNACADPTAVAASSTDAERHSAWAQAQETVQSEVEQKLRQLEALREPEVVQKQLKLVQCRTLHAELAQGSCNIKADENGKFIVSETNKPFDLMEEVKTLFLEDDGTFEREFRGYAETEFAHLVLGNAVHSRTRVA
jgi:hypothetical protein